MADNKVRFDPNIAVSKCPIGLKSRSNKEYLNEA